MNTLRFALCLILLQACSNEGPDRFVPDAGQPGSDSSSAADRFPGCSRGELEPDFENLPFSAPIPPGEYLISTTYLELEPDQDALFQEVLGPVIAELQSRSGLVGVALGQSSACSSARTLTVWRDEAAMLEFVVSEAHAKAMQSSSKLSRGGSMAAHWHGDQAAATWDAAAEHLATSDRRMY
jgi:heme-degrading monooxygenase HmoA